MLPGAVAMTTRSVTLVVISIFLVSACAAPLRYGAEYVFAPARFAAPVENSDIWDVLEAILDQEVEAKNSADWEAFRSLVHPDASARWLEQQQNLFDRALADIYITRVERHDDWALAGVIETYRDDEGRTSQVYTTRTFRQGEPDSWKLTSPSLKAWGEQQHLTHEGVQIDFYSFDEPYVRAIAPRIPVALDQLAKDFGATLDDNAVLHVQVAPPLAVEDLSSQGALTTVVQSPLAFGFPLGSAQSPEEFLLGSLVDIFGHALVEQTYGKGATEPGRAALAHTAVQWEVEQALWRDFTSRHAAQVTGSPTPLQELLDPTIEDVTGSRPDEQHLFLRFAVAMYGREIVAPFLQAVYSAGTAEDLVTSAFQTDLSALEDQWHDWLGAQSAADRP